MRSRGDGARGSRSLQQLPCKPTPPHVQTSPLPPSASQGLRHLVLDEADRLLNMDFEQEIDQILKVIPKVRGTRAQAL